MRLPSSAAEAEVDVVASVYDAMLDHLDESGENESEVLDAANAGQRALFGLLAVDGEVNNGGFAQFFTNSTGSLADEALAGAERVGLRAHAEILRAARSIFPGGHVPKDFDQRTEVFESLPEQKQEDELSALDERWYAADDEFLPTLERYVRENRDEFFR